jgi:hypothetical protein
MNFFNSYISVLLPRARLQPRASLLLVFLLFLLVGVPVLADKPPSVKKAGSESVPAEKLVIGQIEYVAIPALDTVFAARIDTGAKRSSIYAVDIQTFERDGNPWVRFTIKNPTKDQEFPMEMEVTRTTRIKQKGDESERRHHIELVLTMGDLTKEIDINLADRSNFEYPLLIGRDFLKGTAVVDVARKFTQKTPGAPSKRKK